MLQGKDILRELLDLVVCWRGTRGVLFQDPLGDVFFLNGREELGVFVRFAAGLGAFEPAAEGGIGDLEFDGGRAHGCVVLADISEGGVEILGWVRHFG